MSELLPTHYLHGTGPGEQERLLRLNGMLNADTLRRLALRGGERVLEVGSGLATLARDMARATGHAVVCVERDQGQIDRSLQLAEAADELPLLDVRQGEATALPLAADEWGCFDVVHCRFVLEHLSDPQAAVEQMKRALRSGGRMVLADDDHDTLRLWPPLPAVEEMWRAYIKAFLDNGNDPFVGRKLVAMMRAADVRPVQNDFIFFGGCAGSERWEIITSNLEHILRGARATIVESSAISETLFDEILESLREWAGRPDSSVWYQINHAEGIR